MPAEEVLTVFPFVKEFMKRITLYDKYIPYMTLELEPEEFEQLQDTGELHSIVNALETAISSKHDYTLCILQKEYYDGQLYYLTSCENVDALLTEGFKQDEISNGDFGEGLYTFDADSRDSLDSIYNWIIRDLYEDTPPDSLYDVGDYTTLSFNYSGTIYRCVHGIDHAGYILIKKGDLQNTSSIDIDEVKWFDSLQNFTMHSYPTGVTSPF